MALTVWCAFRWRDAPADTTCSGLAGGCGLELTADGCWLCTGVQVWGRGYLGLLFNNCLFSYSKGACELKDLNLLLLHSQPPYGSRLVLFLLFFPFLILAGANNNTDLGFLYSYRESFESSNT